MIKEVLNGYFADRARLPIEHKDRLYPAQASVYITNPTHKKLHGHCMRASYYSCLGLEEEVSTELSHCMLRRLGDYTERMIIDMLRNKEALVESGVKFDIEQYKIYGKLDAIVKIDDEEKGLEIKSISSNKYTVGQIFGSSWNEPTPKWNHLFQTLVYCYAFRDRLSEFILLYIRRDNGDMKEFVISTIVEDGITYPVIDGKVDYRYSVNDMLERYRQLHEYVEKGQVPPREYVKTYRRSDIPRFVRAGILSRRQAENYEKTPFGDYECRSCGYCDICDKDI